MLKVPLAGKSLVQHEVKCIMGCNVAASWLYLLLLFLNGQTKTDDIFDIFSLWMKFIIVMIKKLVQQLPSAALAKKKTTRNQIIGKNNNPSRQTA